MSVRNCGELGINLQKIVNRLMSNDNLVKLLYYTDKDPLNGQKLTAEEKENLVFEKLIKVIPRIGPKEDAKSIVCVSILKATKDDENNEFKDVDIVIDIYVPLTQYFIKDTNLRPFAILGEIQSSLDKKIINGLGKIKGGDFILNFTTEEVVSYQQYFSIKCYD